MGLGYEWNIGLQPRFSTLTFGEGSQPMTSVPAPGNFKVDGLRSLIQPLLPGLSVGWRTGRLLLVADGQHVYSSGVEQSSSAVTDLLIGNGWSARLTAAYRLGRNPDARKAGPKPQQ